MSVRSASLLARAVEALQDDLNHAADLLEDGLEVLRDLEPVVRGLNGISAIVRAKGNETENLVRVLREEATSLPKKLAPPTRDPEPEPEEEETSLDEVL